ncbi:hypothetical protein [Nonomuraea composti]|nr:hypothetical protein [Nonomuraea sp. FMUSA5-5]
MGRAVPVMAVGTAVPVVVMLCRSGCGVGEGDGGGNAVRMVVAVR